MPVTDLAFVLVFSHLFMGFVTCWMRVNISHVSNFEAGVVALVFWLWPVWFLWVFPTWIHEHIVAQKTDKTNWE